METFSQRNLGLPVPYGELTIGRFLRGAASRHGPRPALIGSGPDISYDLLYAKCRALARGLIALGVQPGMRVALLLGNSNEFVIGWYAAGLAGAVTVPISTYATPEEIDDALLRSRATVLIARPGLAKRRYFDELAARHAGLAGARVGGPLSPFPDLKFIVDAVSPPVDCAAFAMPIADALSRGTAVDGQEIDRRMEAIGPDDEGTILFTSGSTGKPKAILHAQRTPVIMGWRWALELELQPSHRAWSGYPFFWSAGLAMGMGGPLSAGAALALQPVIEPGATLDLFARERIDILLTPTHVDVELAAEQRQRPRQLPSLKRVRAGVRLQELLGVEPDPRDIGAGYGLSETFTIVSTMKGLDEEARRTSHGSVFPAVEVRIVDPATGVPLPDGESGEIAIRGVTRMIGYIGVPAEECFDAEGYYRPGDIGRIDEQGLLYWEGRGREMIRSRGANVAPVEIENVLLQWGGIKFPRACGVPHPVMGEAIVVCGVRPKASSVTEADVAATLKARLTAYKLPYRILFFEESELNLTGSQKVKGADIKRMATERILATDADAEWTRFLATKG